MDNLQSEVPMISRFDSSLEFEAFRGLSSRAMLVSYPFCFYNLRYFLSHPYLHSKNWETSSSSLR